MAYIRGSAFSFFFQYEFCPNPHSTIMYVYEYHCTHLICTVCKRTCMYFTDAANTVTMS